jgi:two-component sensor histidine kinase
MDNTQTITDIRCLQTELLGSVIERAELHARSIIAESQSRTAARAADIFARAKREATVLAQRLRAEAATAEVDAAFAVAAERLRSMDEAEQRHLLQCTIEGLDFSVFAVASS